MFFTKSHIYLKNIISIPEKVTCNGNFTINRFFSDVSSDKTPKLDKLYRKLAIEVRGNDPAVLKSYGIFSSTAASHLGITVGRNAPAKRYNVERFTVLKSAFVHKKHRVQYEFRTYYRYLDFLRLTGSTADTLLEYLQRNLPEGVAMKVTKYEISALPEAVRESPQISV